MTTTHDDESKRTLTETMLNWLLDRWLMPRTLNGIGSPMILHKTKRFAILMEVKPLALKSQQQENEGR